MTSTCTSAISGSSSLRSHLQSASACSRSESKSSPDFSDRGASDDIRVKDLAEALFGYETLLQQIFAEGGRLATAAIKAQTHENLSPLVGHQILSAITNAQLSITGALGYMAEGHRQLEVLARKLGIDPEAFGDVVKRPSARGAASLELAA